MNELKKLEKAFVFAFATYASDSAVFRDDAFAALVAARADLQAYKKKKNKMKPNQKEK